MMKLHFHGATLFILLLLRRADSTPPPFSCDSSDPQTKSFPFCNTTLPIHERVEDLISRLTLDEKISQLVDNASAIPRLGIPAYQWWSEALHGVAILGRGISFEGRISSATSFPQVILSASTFDSHLWYRIGQATGKEARALYNAGQAKGMTFWAPNINIFRDPRWGRGHETPGEDPLVAAKYAVAYVRGLQGESYEGNNVSNNVHLQASACCKHFTAYDLESWKGVSRLLFDAEVTKQDLADTYQPPFKSCVQEGRASAMMCAHNKVNGVPNCANYDLLTKTARGEWGFQGYIACDCDSVGVIYEFQKYAKSAEDAVADVLEAGMDLNCGEFFTNYAKSAVEQKKVSLSQIDRAFYNVFSVRMRLGLFNGDPTKQPFGNIGPHQVCSKEHQELALEAARNGIVLLKNSGNLLPLSKSETSSLAIIGPNADNAYVLLGDCEGPTCKSMGIRKALQGYVRNTFYHKGCNFVNCTYAAIEDAVEKTKDAYHVVLVMGMDQSMESELHDREDLRLPGEQESLIMAVATAARKPVVLVLVCGGPVDVSFAKDEEKIGSILWAGYPGEAGAIAVAEIIFGEHNPGGKLPVTWYPQDFTNVPMTDMRMRPEPSSGYPGRTYRFYNGPKVFDFGYGLSYSTYSYHFISSTPNIIQLNQLFTPITQQTDQSSSSIPYLSVSKIGTDICETLEFLVHVVVENTGDMAGKHPVLLFVRHERHSIGSPVKQLVGFQSVSLSARERIQIEFVLNPCEHLSEADEDGFMVIKEGNRYLVVEDEEYPFNVVFGASIAK